jgi:uncharacterized protein YcfL
MNKVILTVSLFLFLATACSKKQEEQLNQKNNKEIVNVETELDKAKKEIKSILTDPDSAQFRSVFEDKTSICVEVNAKNQMGGYAGYRFVGYDRLTKKVSLEPGEFHDCGSYSVNNFKNKSGS